MICRPCQRFPAPECAEFCESAGKVQRSCTCQHREAELLKDGTLAPKGVRKDVMR